MNSRMKFGGDFSIPADENIPSMPPWVPVTPQKPNPLKSHPILLNPHGNHLQGANWQHQLQNVQIEESSMSQTLSPQVPRYGGYYSVNGGLAPQNGMINEISGSYSQLLGSDSSSWRSFTQLLEDNAASAYVATANMNLSRSVDMAENAPPTPKLHPQVANPGNNSSSFVLTNRHCNNGSYPSSTVMNRPVVVDFPFQFNSSPGESNAANWLLNDENHCSSSNLLSNGDNSAHISQYVFPPPFRPSYDLNSLPRTEADTTSCIPSQLQFTTNEAKHLENHQFMASQKSLTCESASKGKEKQLDYFISTEGVAIDDHGGELLQNIVNSASAGISTPYKEIRDSDHESERFIDLNKTPQQKPPKKRKHRPKVIREGKPKRTPKPATPKNTEPKDPRTGKRKYVRRNLQKGSSSQLVDSTRDTAFNNAGIGAKSCRRVLDFDLEKTTDGKQGKASDQKEEMQQGNIRNFGFQGTDMATRTSCVSKLKSVELIDVENEVVVEKQIPRTINQPRSSINYIPSNYIIIPKEQESAATVATMEDMQSRNLHVIKGHADSGISELCRRSCGFETTTMPQCRHVEGIGKNNGENRERIEDTVIQSACQSALKVISPPNEGRRSKRVHSHNIQPTHTSHNNRPCSFLCEETFEVDGSQENNCTISKEFSEIQKKQKFEQGYLSIYDKLSKVATMEESLGRVERKRANDATLNGVAVALNHAILNSYIGSNRKAEKQSSGINKFASGRFIESIASENNSPKKQFPSKVNSSYQEITQVHSLSTHSTIETCDPLVSSPPGKSRRRGKKQIVQNHDSKSATKLTKGPTLSTSLLSGPDKVLQEQDALYDHQQSSAKTLGLPIRTIYPSVMDDIIHRFNGLTIDRNCNTIVELEKNALVPYKGDGAVVPYEGEFIKKRKPRPKVELDSETNRIWNLLMGKEKCEGNEGPDKVKEKFWEEERKVFQGRVDSFIARMHLVQGDRRFSRWKGSVVDSVVGVFLTQNVSDHLSSSAFMSLAARFPLQSKRNHQAQDKVGTNILAEEPGVRITIPDDATECHEVTSQPIYNKISMTLHESADHQRHRETSRTESNIGDIHSQLLEEEFLSSQDSFGSSVTQGTVGIRSYSVSNSETEGPTAGRKPDKVHRSISAYQPMNKATAFQEFYLQATGSSLLDDGSKPRHNHYGQRMTRSDRIDDFSGTSSFTNPINLENGNMQPSVSPYSSNHMHIFLNSGESEPFVWESFSEESISSSTASRFNTAKDDNRKSLGTKEFLGSNVGSSVEQNNLCRSQEMATRDPYEALRQHSTDQQNYSQPRSRDEYTQPSCSSHQHEGNQTFLSDNTSFIKPVKHTEPLPGKKNDVLQHVPVVNQLKKKSSNAGDSISKEKKQMNSENGLVHSNPEEQFSSYGQSHSEITTNISKGRKGKAESENKNAADWDSLRKQVLADGRKKDRNEDAMDSLDYEALINANVKEISHAIRERGMNNMLAERIQEFLNRVVKDHGSIDLEWLRDVPPDKAKDYLLSIRGLGLKSVECIRLLTLHHLAFPVDTNVGRIAVRLGWVPLQPLPESLQLHLLELYPMLETIQKYLWPRLCKLDQLTLYELHYQMITFGKVFCTKSKPNCNACPMRGECRHFASAFASARLALPGPEDKSIVSSTTSTVAEKSPTMTGDIMSLPPPENNLLQQVSTYADNCQPIIEEPATPEQEFVDLSQSDIEDLSYEDPDEIPTIQLNIEEFTETLQNYMQENMELQEGDMSKALVALNPEAASLPTPMLKNVSRLRTEHQVYELPDSHPLLQGMDRREPDDPSPYLLAIWTPGETANSVQPPERRCGSQDENKLCNEKTCFSCNSIREENSQIVRGTILIPCRTAMRGSFPLNGTYFQVNEMFADHDSSDKPIDVPRGWIWNLPRRTVYFGTSVSSIFKGLTTEGIQYCFWRGYVCVRGFDRTSRAPKPLIARLHFPASRMTIKTRNEKQGDKKSPRRREGFHQGKAD